jgi:hypothetical protein
MSVSQEFMKCKSSDTWLTPKWVIDAIGLSDLDPCGYKGGSIIQTAHECFCLENDQDGLAEAWFGSIYCNPPYSKVDPWLKKGIQYYEETGEDVIFLVSVRTGTKWWKNLREAYGIVFIEKPLKFLDKEGVEHRRSPYPSALVAMNEHAYERIKKIEGMSVLIDE